MAFECNVAALANQARCFRCLDDKSIEIVKTYLLCQILSNGGSGTSCLLCGITDPVDAPACSCAIYYNTANEGVWYWNSTNSSWKAMLAPL